MNIKGHKITHFILFNVVALRGS